MPFFLHDVMATYLRKFVNKSEQPNTSEKLKQTLNDNETTKKDTGSGDFEFDKPSFILSDSISKYNDCPPEKSLHKQAQNTKTLVRSLEHEIAESREDIRYLHNHIFSAEEVFPKRWEMCHSLKKQCKEQADIASIEILKWKRKSERFDIEMKELEQRIGSWQCVIDKAKAVQIQETDFFE